jgi:hypothetical protein
VLEGFEASLDGRDHQIADHFAGVADLGDNWPSDDLAVAGVDDEDDANDFAIAGVHL